MVKTVANEKCSGEIREFSSAENLFRVYHATQNARNILKRKIFG